MLKIRYFTPNQLFTDGGFDIENKTNLFFMMMDSKPDVVHRVLNRDGKWQSATGHIIKVPMVIYNYLDAVEIDDSETTGSETKEILICKVPEGYLMGIYLF
jgi:hypothetical protein